MASPGNRFRRDAAWFWILMGMGLLAILPRLAWCDDPPEENRSGAFDNIEIVDVALKDKLIIQRVGSDRPHGGLLSVFAGFKNTTDEALKIEVQTIYRDDIGDALVNGKASWISMLLPPHSETVYRSASISSAAADFLIRVRFDKS